MDRNVCGVDQKARLSLGLGLLVYALSRWSATGPESVSKRRVLAGYGAAELLLINGLIQWCPLNYALGINTCDRDWPELIAGALGRGKPTESEGLLPSP